VANGRENGGVYTPEKMAREAITTTTSTAMRIP
jgi:hypothetical protein